MKKRTLLLPLLLLLIFPSYAWKTVPSTEVIVKTSTEASFKEYSTNLYNLIDEKELDFTAFESALKGYLTLASSQQIDNSKYLSIIDFSKSSSENRLFIIDMEAKKLVQKSLVAHGRNSGLEYASQFSNKVQSFQSSIGFYKTAETYIGKHGFSLRLDGLEYSNNNARSRAIVIHGADYASAEFVTQNGRLGRSLGCPSLPKTIHKEVIETIKEGTCLFIYYPKEAYLQKSKLLNSNTSTSI
tara:strand:+ start:12483 stop:13208 length:726 start_codon:yes stop_codon:yes gene_type:complete